MSFLLYIVSADLVVLQKDILKCGTLHRAHQILKTVFCENEVLASLHTTSFGKYCSNSYLNASTVLLNGIAVNIKNGQIVHLVWKTAYFYIIYSAMLDISHCVFHFLAIVSHLNCFFFFYHVSIAFRFLSSWLILRGKKQKNNFDLNFTDINIYLYN